MSSQILALALSLAQLILGVSLLCATYRLMAGPRAQDRVLGLDSVYVNAMLMLLVFGISTGKTVYFEAALIIAILGFAATMALAKFLMRGEVIE